VRRCLLAPLQLSRPGVSAVSDGLGDDEADGVAPPAKEEDIAGQRRSLFFEGGDARVPGGGGCAWLWLGVWCTCVLERWM
jgi:hypothetical protein